MHLHALNQKLLGKQKKGMKLKWDKKEVNLQLPSNAWIRENFGKTRYVFIMIAAATYYLIKFGVFS